MKTFLVLSGKMWFRYKVHKLINIAAINVNNGWLDRTILIVQGFCNNTTNQETKTIYKQRQPTETYEYPLDW